MKKVLYSFLLFASFYVQAQDDIVKNIIAEATNNSQLEVLAHELLDVVGPRLTGTPQMKNAADWAMQRYSGWGIKAKIHEFGEWQGWKRGITHIDMVSPRIRTLSGTQLAYSPSTTQRGVTAGLAVIPEVKNKEEFKNIRERLIEISYKLGISVTDFKINAFTVPQIASQPGNLTIDDISNFMALSDMEIIKSEYRQFLPINIFGISFLVNNFIATLPFFNKFCLRNYIVARQKPIKGNIFFSASILIPCKNEKGNIENAIKRIPYFCSVMEIIFIEGGRD